MNNLLSDSTNFTAKNISLKRAVEILAKNDIEVNDRETAIILDFLYHMAQNHNKHEAHKKINTLMGNRTY
jgi:hypothetical protein